MHQPPALYSISHLLTEHLPQLPDRLRAVLALWVEGTLLGLNGCQDAVTLALAQCLRGPRNPHTLRRRQRELLYDDADRIDSWGPGQELEVERCFAPLLQWVRSWWVPTGGRELHKGIFWAGIGVCVRIGGPAPCVAGPSAARAPVSVRVRAERRRGGGRAGGAS